MVSFDRERVLKNITRRITRIIDTPTCSNFQRRAIQTTYSYLVTDYVEGEGGPFYDMQWNLDKWGLQRTNEISIFQ